MDACQLFVGAVLCHPSFRERLLKSLRAAFETLPTQPGFAGWSFQFVEHAELKSLATALDSHFREQPQPRAIVVSDQLNEPLPGKPPHASPTEHLWGYAKELFDPYYLQPLGMLAATLRGKQVSDVDRTIRLEASREEVAAALLRVARRLEYVARPARQTELAPNFIVRRLNNEFELLQYFRLRHEVYSVMGYLSEEKEQVQSRMEIDGCDPFAIHLGAFHRGEGFEELAGTARLLLAPNQPNAATEWVHRLLAGDRRLRSIVANENLSLQLPIFHSQDLNPQLWEITLEELRVAELSRVIVSPAFRGTGLSPRIVAQAIVEARELGVDRIFLECLKLHVPLYARFGFTVIPNTQGEVIGVRRSMVAMQLDLKSPPPQPPSRDHEHAAH